MLFEDETSLLAHVFNGTAVLRGTAAAVVDSGRVLELRETTAWGGDAGTALALVHLLLGLGEGHIVVLNLGEELFRVLLFLVLYGM